ncbi:hypothetical protein V6N11_040334 [Hibiscus sabdariffa]|uniref:Uncharacterized protein n=1 Tax=Hibiscus sabdariffa TaxID=183260 RepID=A0ABR2RH87_9ROSI
MCQQHLCLICFWHYAGSSVLLLHLVMVMMLEQSSLTLKSVLKLISERAMLVPECKRSVTHILNALLLEKGTGATMLLCLLDVRKGWIEDDFNKQARQSPLMLFTRKEIVPFLPKLSQVDKQNFQASALEEGQKISGSLWRLC